MGCQVMVAIVEERKGQDIEKIDQEMIEVMGDGRDLDQDQDRGGMITESSERVVGRGMTESTEDKLKHPDGRILERNKRKHLGGQVLERDKLKHPDGPVLGRDKLKHPGGQVLERDKMKHLGGQVLER